MLISRPGVVRGLGELTVKKTLLTFDPIVENWSCVEPLTVWKTLLFTPPDVRPVARATVPVMRAAPPMPTPRACVAAPPTRPWMTLPRPRSIFVGLPVRERVDVTVSFVSITIVLTCAGVKLGAFKVLTVRVEANISFDTICVDDMPDVEIKLAFIKGDDIKTVAVKDGAVALDMTLLAVRELTNREDINTEFWAARIRFPLLPVM